MPNGEDKNWVRLCAAIDGFRARYKRWPNRILIGRLEHGDLVWMLTKESYAKLTEKLTFIVQEDLGMAAEDDEGRKYDYGMEGFCKTPPDILASEWLAVEPDSDEYFRS